jgi:hypothetical protein
MIKEKYKNQEHLIYRLSQLFYLKDIGFINDLATDLMNDNENDINISKQITIDILEYGILSNKIEIINLSTQKTYSKLNFKDLSNIVDENFEQFLNIFNKEFPYKYDIAYTDYWKKELGKFGLWKL